MLLEKSLINCHIQGVHSVVFNDAPYIRAFFTTQGHQLNHPNAVAIHNHHCDLKLIILWGEVINVTWEKFYTNGLEFKEYKFQSHIKTNNGNFIETGGTTKLKAYERLYKPGDIIQLSSLTYHTIYTQQDRAAWLIIEGTENPGYQGYCYAVSKPQITPDLYQPMTAEFYKENFRK